VLYYKKLLMRKKLVKYWLFFNGSLGRVFKSSYMFFGITNKNSCFLNLSFLIGGIKKLTPLFLMLSKTGGNVCFVTVDYMYGMVVATSMFTKQLIFAREGVFTNFAARSYALFHSLDFLLNPAVVIFLNQKRTCGLLYETRIKNIPTVALVVPGFNIGFVEYPIFVNSVYFYTVYFFTRFFYKFLACGRIYANYNI
jgi:hypothetical protein